MPRIVGGRAERVRVTCFAVTPWPGTNTGPFLPISEAVMLGGQNRRWAAVTIKVLLTGVLAAPFAAVPASAARAASMTDLGTLGGAPSQGTAINALGRVT